MRIIPYLVASLAAISAGSVSTTFPARLAVGATYLGVAKASGEIGENVPLSVSLATGIAVTARMTSSGREGAIVVEVSGNPTQARPSVLVTLQVDVAHDGPIRLVGDAWRYVPSALGGHNIRCGDRYNRAGTRIMLSATLPLAGAARTYSFGWSACAVGDLDGDGSVDGADVATVLSAWGTSGNGVCADVTRDGVVDGADLAVILSDWIVESL